MEDGVRLYGAGYDRARADSSHREKVTGLGRRGARKRVEAPGERDAAIAVALRRLEREHVALLLALCELEGASGAAETPAMREALRVLLRDDLGRTQHALALAAQDRYGVCEDCQRPIARRALELSPVATRCTFCQAHR